MSRLTRQTAALPEQERLPERILQFGDGNFLRGFADDFVDRMNREADFNSGVVIVPPASTGKTVGMITEGTEKGNIIVWVLAASFTVAMIPVTVTLKRKSR